MAEEPTAPIEIDISVPAAPVVVQTPPVVPAATVPIVPTVVETKPETTDPAVAVEDLKRQIKERDEQRERDKAALVESNRRATEEANRRIAAERAAAENATKVTVAETSQQEAEYGSIVTALNALQSEEAALTDQLAAFNTEGKFQEAAKIQAKLGRVGARIESLESGKEQFDRQREAAKNKPVAQPQPQPIQKSVEEQREDWLRTVSGPSAGWIRQHPQYFTDGNFQAKVNAAHNYNLHVRGMRDDNPEFFKHIEEAVGLRQAEGNQPVTTQPTRVAPVMVAAPPSAPAAGGAGIVNGTKVTLTADEQKMAYDMFTKETSEFVAKGGSPLTAFAMQRARQIAEGKWFNGR